MTWIGTEDVIEFTGVKPQTFRFEKGDDASCLRLTANMVALAQARKDTPVIQVKEWNVQTVSSNIFSNDLKRDLTPFVHERKSYKGDEIDFFVITGDDDSW